jgi:hypothetical protein
MPSKLLLGNTQLSACPTIGQWGFSIIRDRQGDPSNDGWDYLGEARGTITVPALKELRAVGVWMRPAISRLWRPWSQAPCSFWAYRALTSPMLV